MNTFMGVCVAILSEGCCPSPPLVRIPPGSLDSFMCGNYPASLQNVGFFTLHVPELINALIIIEVSSSMSDIWHQWKQKKSVCDLNTQCDLKHRKINKLRGESERSTPDLFRSQTSKCTFMILLFLHHLIVDYIRHCYWNHLLIFLCKFFRFTSNSELCWMS